MRIKRLFPGLIASLCAGYLIQGCSDDNVSLYSCPDDPVSYSSTVAPIVNMKCAISGCHNGDLGANLNWTDFGTFQDKAKSGIVRTRVINRIMPPANSPAGPLTQEEINAIACWADQGANNN